MQPREAHAQREQLQLLDVREQSEWDAGHVDGSLHIPMGQLPARLDELETGRPVLAICRSGARSGRVTAWLDAQGYDAHNLEGGLKAWHAQGLPLRRDAEGAPTVA